MGAGSPNPEGEGFDSPDLGGMGSVSPDPWGTGSASPGSVGPTTFNHNRHKSSKPGVKLLTPDGNGHASTRTVAIMGHAWRAHVAHSVEQGRTGHHD
jgi:hypothetical protein